MELHLSDLIMNMTDIFPNINFSSCRSLSCVQSSQLGFDNGSTFFSEMFSWSTFPEIHMEVGSQNRAKGQHVGIWCKSTVAGFPRSQDRGGEKDSLGW